MTYSIEQASDRALNNDINKYTTDRFDQDMYDEKLSEQIDELVDDSELVTEIAVNSDKAMSAIVSMFKAYRANNASSLLTWANQICIDIEDEVIAMAEGKL